MKHLLVAAIASALLLSGAQAFADPLDDAYRQRIGNYDVEMTTEPKSPVAGGAANVLVRIAGVNGDDLIDVPIMLRLFKDGSEIHRTNPIIVPYGHHVQEYTFSEQGRYVMYVDLNDYSYSGQTLTFTFFVNVAGPFDFMYIAAPSAAAAAVGVAGMLFFVKKRKKNQLSA